MSNFSLLRSSVAATPVWTMSLCARDGEAPSSHRIADRAFLVGRTTDADIHVPSTSVSRRHAELALADGRPFIRDLGSANGTFVNGARIDESFLKGGDFVQFGEVVFRIGQEWSGDAGGTVEAGSLPWAQALLQFDSLMTQERLTPFFQPIVSLPAGETVGFELLARSQVEGLETPGKMFAVAESLEQERALSELSRHCGVRAADTFVGPLAVFVNSHPAEVGDDRLIRSLEALRVAAPRMNLVVEVHEAAVTDPACIRSLRAAVDRLGMGLAYDDFGAGQARLEELTDIPPDYLKFDMGLIRGIDVASKARRDLVESLVRVARSLGAVTLAEGIETDGEAKVCAELGFELAQGYAFGRPAPPDTFR